MDSEQNSYLNHSNDWLRAPEIEEKLKKGLEHAMYPFRNKAGHEIPKEETERLYVTNEKPLIVRLEILTEMLRKNAAGKFSANVAEVEVPKYKPLILNFKQILSLPGSNVRLSAVSKSTALIGGFPSIEEFVIVNLFLVHKDALTLGLPGPFPPVPAILFNDRNFRSYFKENRIAPKYWRDVRRENLSEEYNMKMLKIHQQLQAAFPVYDQVVVFSPGFAFDLRGIQYRFNLLTEMSHREKPQILQFSAPVASDPFSKDYVEKHDALDIITRRLAGTMKTDKKKIIDKANRYERENAVQKEDWLSSFSGCDNFSGDMHIPQTSRLNFETDSEKDRIYLLQDAGKYAWDMFLNEQKFPDLEKRTMSKFARNLGEGINLGPKIVNHPGYFLLTSFNWAQSLYRFQLALAAFERLQKVVCENNFDPKHTAEELSKMTKLLAFLSQGQDTALHQYKKISAEIKNMPVSSLPSGNKTLDELARLALTFPLQSRMEINRGKIDNAKVTDRQFAYETKRETQLKMCKYKHKSFEIYNFLKRSSLLSERSQLYEKVASEGTENAYATPRIQRAKEEEQNRIMRQLQATLEKGGKLTGGINLNKAFNEAAAAELGKTANKEKIVVAVEKGKPPGTSKLIAPPPRRASNH